MRLNMRKHNYIYRRRRACVPWMTSGSFVHFVQILLSFRTRHRGRRYLSHACYTTHRCCIKLHRHVCHNPLPLLSPNYTTAARPDITYRELVSDLSRGSRCNTIWALPSSIVWYWQKLGAERTLHVT